MTKFRMNAIVPMMTSVTIKFTMKSIMMSIGHDGVGDHAYGL